MAGFLRVNICSIRSVTTKPPTMLTAASTIAIRPTTTATVLSVVPVTMIAPSRMIPWIAFAPDINGVCSVEETLEITSMPDEHAEDEDRQPDDSGVEGHWSASWS